MGLLRKFQKVCQGHLFSLLTKTFIRSRLDYADIINDQVQGRSQNLK